MVLVFAVGVVACDSTTAPPPSALAPEPASDIKIPILTHTVLGVGTVDLSSAGATPMSFAVAAFSFSDGLALGNFWQKRDHGGLNVEFVARLTCLSVDPVNHRAWIGGVIVENRSTDPAFMVAGINDPGDDIWFRVLDDGFGAVDPDRSTTLGFKGSAGFNTSADYCAGKPWPDPPPNARTFPVASGNIIVH
jgi:hypothetical protein